MNDMKENTVQQVQDLFTLQIVLTFTKIKIKIKIKITIEIVIEIVIEIEIKIKNMISELIKKYSIKQHYHYKQK